MGQIYQTSGLLSTGSILYYRRLVLFPFCLMSPWRASAQVSCRPGHNTIGLTSPRSQVRATLSDAESMGKNPRPVDDHLDTTVTLWHCGGHTKNGVAAPAAVELRVICAACFLSDSVSLCGRNPFTVRVPATSPPFSRSLPLSVPAAPPQHLLGTVCPSTTSARKTSVARVDRL